ncbi:hypothetical protein VE03_08297 [Pseudogymnoascus sp. 23342-1-I1]|nr:hypothetical protein VE03_08297 [Pseudogymnoascus sp. 23342-1-I1]
MTSASPSPRTPFPPSPDGAAAPPLPHAPALSSANARARFEFEAGRGAEGSKVLMVEWSVPVSALGAGNDAGKEDVWEVSWEGKAQGVVHGSGSATVDEAEGRVIGDSAAGESEGGKEAEGQALGKVNTHRLYFLLPPPTPVPRLVNISRRGDDGEALHTNPLPAIFPPELGASARTAGRKGVLHTRWAKRRVAVLEAEIEREGGLGEGVGWEMAVREKVWIEENFGVGKGAKVEEGGKTPGSPLGRVPERMRGLKLGTSPGELGVHAPEPLNPLSPAPSDVAIAAPAFALFHAPAPSAPTQLSEPASIPARAVPTVVSQLPPASIIAQQASAGDGRLMSSLDALAGGDTKEAGMKWTPAEFNVGGNVGGGGEDDGDAEGGKDELFAIPPLPRGPEMARSPFSLVSEEVVPWR